MHNYYIYKDIWEATVSEKALVCVSKPRNTHDQYAMAVEKNGTAEGHLLQKVSRVCTLFLKKGSCIHCRVTERQRYLIDLR